MAKKSSQRKPQFKRSPEAATGKSALVPSATYKPWQVAVVCFVLALSTLLTFQGVRHNGFLTYDDMDYVVQNRDVHQGVTIESIQWAFTTFRVSNWHPLTWISHMVDWSLYGNNPAGHHLTNLFLHTTNSILLFLLLLYMTGFLGRSAMVAFLFALHPVHVESVAWLAERKDVLCAFFFLATLLAYAWNLRKPSWKRYLLVVCAFACALMSKPMAVTLPFTLLLLDIWPLRRISFDPEACAQWFSSFWKLCLEKWPLFIMAISSSIVTYIAQRAGHSVALLEELPLWQRTLNAAIGYCRYLLLTFWPNPLTAYYYYDVVHIQYAAAILSIAALALITIACWHFRKDKPYCLVGWLWFLGTFVPVIGFVQVGEQFMAERYTYLPLIGIFIAVVWLIGEAVSKSPNLRIATQLLAILVIAACAVRSYAQVKIWKDNITLFSHVLQVDPRGALSNFSLGMAYENAGKLAEAQDYVDRSLLYNSTKPLILSYSAYCMMQLMGQTHDWSNLPLVGQRLEAALRLDPNFRDALNNMARWSLLMNKPQDAETYSRRTLAVAPNFQPAQLFLADALRAQDKLDEAAREYRQVLANDPNVFDAHNNIGIILEKEGQKQEALKEFELSLSINPNQAMPHSRIGVILIEAHQIPAAVAEFTKAVRLDPASPHAHDDLGVALFQLGDYEKAIEQFRDAITIDPTYAGARQNLDLTLAHMNAKKVAQAR
ncbi:MAG: tetratricopeptide repeat protein [Terracidiphilus sp.]|jgi:tetratricopeptide (TPR) repeat protein